MLNGSSLLPLKLLLILMFNIMKTEKEFTVKVVNQENEVVAEVTKLVYVALKDSNIEKPAH